MLPVKFEIGLYIFIYNTLYMKTITISDDVYWKLVSIKGDRSFSKVIDDLIRSSVSLRARKILEVTIESENVDELEDIMKEIRRSFRVRT